MMEGGVKRHRVTQTGSELIRQTSLIVAQQQLHGSGYELVVEVFYAPAGNPVENHEGHL